MTDETMTLEWVRDLLLQAPATSMIGSYVAPSVPDAAAVLAIESAMLAAAPKVTP